MRIRIEGNNIHLQTPHYVVDGNDDSKVPPPIAVQEFTLHTTDGGETFTIVMRPGGSEFSLHYRREQDKMTLLLSEAEFVLYRINPTSGGAQN